MRMRDYHLTLGWVCGLQVLQPVRAGRDDDRTGVNTGDEKDMSYHLQNKDIKGSREKQRGPLVG